MQKRVCDVSRRAGCLESDDAVTVERIQITRRRFCNDSASGVRGVSLVGGPVEVLETLAVGEMSALAVSALLACTAADQGSQRAGKQCRAQSQQKRRQLRAVSRAAGGGELFDGWEASVAELVLAAIAQVRTWHQAAEWWGWSSTTRAMYWVTFGCLARYLALAPSLCPAVMRDL